MCETIPSRCQLTQEDPAPGAPCRRSVERDLTWITSGSVKAEMGGGAYLAHPALRVASALFWPVKSVHLRAVASRRANGVTSAMPILSFRPSPPLPPGKGYLGAKAQSKATLVGAALISASVSPLFSRVDDQYTL
jgi:hypothetical protein